MLASKLLAARARASRANSHALIGALVGSVLLGGCGSSSPSTSSNASKTSGQAASAPITRAQASAYANAVNLTAADVPGMTGTPRHPHEESSSPEVMCGLREAHNAVADIKSPKFTSGSGLAISEVESEVEVAPSAAQAAAKLAQLESAIAKPSARACLERTISQAFAKGVRRASTGGVQVKLGRTAISLLPPSEPHSFGLQILLPVTVVVKGISLQMHVYVRAVGFIVGPAAISLTTIGYSNPFPAATQQHLLSTLDSRAKSSAI